MKPKVTVFWQLIQFTLANLSHLSWLVVGLAGVPASVALEHPILSPPTPSVLENRQETSIPDQEQRILIVSGKDEGEEGTTEVGADVRSLLLSHSSQDIPPTHTPFPFAAENLTETEPTPPPQPNPVPGDEPLEQEVEDAVNPITRRINIPIVNRTAFGIGTFNRTANLTAIQPVLPLPLGENYLVVRPSLPFVYAPTVTQPQGGKYGLGDFAMQIYFVPKPTGNLIWGIGPTFLFPTASDRTLGFGKWGIGPALAVVWSEERLTVGGIVQNYWSVAGDEGRANVSQLTMQPFVTYILDNNGWYLVSAPTITAFWNIPGEKWVIPIGGGIGKIVKLGDRPFNISIQAYWQPVRPGNSEGWAIVVQLQSIFPQQSSK